MSVSGNYAKSFGFHEGSSGESNKSGRKHSCLLTFQLEYIRAELTLSMMISTKTVDRSVDAPPCRLIGLFLTLHAWTFLLWYLLNRALSGMFKSFTAWNLVFSFVNVSLFKDIDASDTSSRQKTSHAVLKTSQAHLRNSCSCPHKSSPSTIFIRRSPPSSPKKLSRNLPNEQKFGYADEPKANTANLGRKLKQTLFDVSYLGFVWIWNIIIRMLAYFVKHDKLLIIASSSFKSNWKAYWNDS